MLAPLSRRPISNRCKAAVQLEEVARPFPLGFALNTLGTGKEGQDVADIRTGKMSERKLCRFLEGCCPDGSSPREAETGQKLDTEQHRTTWSEKAHCGRSPRKASTKRRSHSLTRLHLPDSEKCLVIMEPGHVVRAELILLCHATRSTP